MKHRHVRVVIDGETVVSYVCRQAHPRDAIRNALQAVSNIRDSACESMRCTTWTCDAEPGESCVLGSTLDRVEEFEAKKGTER